MSKDIRFALVRRPTDPDCKPQVFNTLGDLVDFIHRQRGEAGLHPFDAPVEVFGESEPRRGVSIFTTHEGERSGYLGWAYLDGRGREALMAALDAAKPDVPTIGRKAA